MTDIPTYTWDATVGAHANIRRLRTLAKGWAIVFGAGWKAKVWTEPAKPRGSVQVLTTDDGRLRCGSACDQTLTELAEFIRGTLTRHGIVCEP